MVRFTFMDPLMLSRIQFGDTAAFHIIWPLMSIGLAVYMVTMEALWLYTKDESYYRQIRFWLKIFLLTFAIGVGSGFPLQFQFGMNWAAFANAAGSFFGNILGFETTVAFTLETASLGIMVFGWKKVSKLVHFLASIGVLIGASLSGFWIMVANQWMQTPQGVVYENGKFIVTDYVSAIFNVNTMVSFLHMWLACIIATLFMMGGIAAYALLYATKTDAVGEFFVKTLRYVIVLALIATPLQIVLGDVSGYLIAKHQPEKLAAVELHWDTNLPGTGAPWSLIAFPDASGSRNDFAIQLPNMLSILTKHSLTGAVPGLNDFPKDTRPTVAQSVIIFYSFRVMVGIGFFLFALTLWSAYLWYRGKLSVQEIIHHPVFLWFWIISIPLGFIATEAGWMVREIGRQPWIVYHTMRTSEGLSSNLSSSVVGSTIFALTAIYTALSFLFIMFTYKIVRAGPDTTSAIP